MSPHNERFHTLSPPDRFRGIPDDERRELQEIVDQVSQNFRRELEQIMRRQKCRKPS